mmetsp:Transcript_5870/g.13926  ORF Transcript_5870/g.13926 Transcript_5870/m.13926 type:complete len:555 (+) Transcript_5870:180-1844(+)
MSGESPDFDPNCLPAPKQVAVFFASRIFGRARPATPPQLQSFLSSPSPPLEGEEGSEQRDVESNSSTPSSGSADRLFDDNCSPRAVQFVRVFGRASAVGMTLIILYISYFYLSSWLQIRDGGGGEGPRRVVCTVGFSLLALLFVYSLLNVYINAVLESRCGQGHAEVEEMVADTMMQIEREDHPASASSSSSIPPSITTTIRTPSSSTGRHNRRRKERGYEGRAHVLHRSPFSSLWRPPIENMIEARQDSDEGEEGSEGHSRDGAEVSMRTSGRESEKKRKVSASQARTRVVEKLKSKAEREGKKYCDKCKAIVGARSRHCAICAGCVERLDHHCVWLGVCIGKKNLRYFHLTLFYGALICACILLCMPSSFAISHPASKVPRSVLEEKAWVVRPLLCAAEWSLRGGNKTASPSPSIAKLEVDAVDVLQRSRKREEGDTDGRPNARVRPAAVVERWKLVRSSMCSGYDREEAFICLFCAGAVFSFFFLLSSQLLLLRCNATSFELADRLSDADLDMSFFDILCMRGHRYNEGSIILNGREAYSIRSVGRWLLPW